MSDDKPKPVDDLKEGLGLLFRAAKGAVERLPTDKLEDVAKDAVKEVGRAFESLGSEIEKVVGGFHSPARPPAPPDPAPEATAEAAPEKKDASPEGHTPPNEAKSYDDGYAPPEPPKGPRVG